MNARGLAETISHIKLYDVEEVAHLIKVHFDIWKAEWQDENRYSDDLIKQRVRLVALKQEIAERRMSAKEVLTKMKLDIKKGKIISDSKIQGVVNEIRKIKAEFDNCNNRLGILTAMEKRINVEKSANEDRLKRVAMYRFIKEKFGQSVADELENEVLIDIES